MTIFKTLFSQIMSIEKAGEPDREAPPADECHVCKEDFKFLSVMDRYETLSVMDRFERALCFVDKFRFFSSISGISITNDTTKRWLRGPFKMQTVLLWRKRSPYADITNKRTKLLYSYEDYIWLDILLYISLSDKDISGQMSARTGKVGRLGFQTQANITRGPKVRRKYWRKKLKSTLIFQDSLFLHWEVVFGWRRNATLIW